MTRSTPKRQIVRSLDEIPTWFASEDAERDWWAAHELSTDVMEAMRPTWEDIVDMGPVNPSARELREVEFPLSIARRHLSLIRRSANKPLSLPGDIRLEHAAIAIVFSAAAVEAGVNLFIAAPVLFVQDEGLRRYFGVLLSRQVRRMSLTDKLAFISKIHPRISPQTGEMAEIRGLIERRNCLVHAEAVFSEDASIAGEEGEEGEGDLAFFRGRPALSTSSAPRTTDIDAAYGYYKAAREFLNSLILAPPAPAERAARQRA